MGKRERRKGFPGRSEPAPEGAAPTAPEEPPAPPRPVPPLPAVLVSAGAWFAGALAHFLGCAKLAHTLGNPKLMPAFLKGLDEVFQNGISTAFDLAVGVAWMIGVVVALAPLAIAWFTAESRLAGTRYAAAPDAGIAVTWPVLAVTLLALLILPLQSHTLPASPTGLELAEARSFDAFLNTMAAGCFAMIAIQVLFSSLFAAAALFAEYAPDGRWQLLVAILFGIACSVAFALVVGPFALELNAAFGAVRGMTVLLAGWAVASGLPLLVLNRRA